MKRNVDLGKFRRARVWLDELPPAPVLNTESVYCSYPSQPAGTKRTCKAGLELYVPTGPSYMYGMLGAVMIPAEESTFEVEVLVSEEAEKYTNSLLGAAGQAWWGLPKEYLVPVLAGITLANSKPERRCSGMLMVTNASFSFEGSNELIFERIGEVLMWLLSLVPDSINDQDFEKLMAEELHYL